MLLTLLLLAGGFALAEKWKQVAVLTSDAYQDETSVVVDNGAQIVVDKDVLIESRDGKTKETYEVKSVYGGVVMLKSHLKSPFDAGSRVYQ
jgi:hypothetical protein